MHVNQSPTTSSSQRYPAPTSPAQLIFFPFKGQTHHFKPSSANPSDEDIRFAWTVSTLSSTIIPFRSHQHHEPSPRHYSSLHRRNHLLLCPILRAFSKSLTTLLLYRPHAGEYRLTYHLCHIRRLRLNIPSDNWETGLVPMDSSKKLQARNVVGYRRVV